MNPQQGEDLGAAPPWMPPQQPAAGRPRFSWTALGTAVLAAAALVVAIIALAQSRTTTASLPPPAPVTPSASPASGNDYTSANRALCTAIGPVISEDDQVARTLSDLGPAGSAGWNSGVSKFINDTKGWLGRVQPVIDSHPNVEPFLHRSLQRFVDDQRNLVADLEAGPWQRNDQTLWDDSSSVSAGPQAICWDLGVKWSR
jgi:hypothetical protein